MGYVSMQLKLNITTQNLVTDEPQGQVPWTNCLAEIVPMSAIG